MEKLEGNAGMNSLKEHTRELLKASGRSNREIAEELGCSVTWVEMFLAGRIKAPNVDIIQKLYEHLTGTSLLKA